MAREIKDELQGTGPAVGGASPGLPGDNPQTGNPGNSIQIPTTEELENTFVQTVMEDFDTMKRAKEKRDYGIDSKGGILDFTKWVKMVRDLYDSRRESKTIPWRFCSNRSLRISAAILDMLHARFYAAIVNPDLVRWKVNLSLDGPKKEKISKLMYWWVWVRSELQTFFDNWIKMTLGYGETLVQSSWKAEPIDTGKTNEEPVTDETGNPLMNPDGTPAVVKSRKIDLLESTHSKAYMSDQYWFQEGSVDIQREPVILEDSFFYRELEDGEAKGQFRNVTNLLRDKIPVGKLAMGIDPAEAEKIKNLKIRNYPVKVLTEYLSFDADNDGFAEDIRVYVSSEYRIYLGGVAVKNLTYSGKRPLTFTKFESRFSNPNENWGMGILEKVRELSDEIDAIFNQMTDANTMMVLKPGFYDPFGDLDAPSLNLQPNRITPLSNPSQSIYFPAIDSPVEKLINAIRLVLEFIERLTAASSYVLGKESEIVGGSGTATRTNAIVQAAQQRFELPSARLRRGAAGIIKNHLDLVQLNIPPGLENRILGENDEPLFGPNELSQAGIAGDLDCYLLVDPSDGSQETERQISGMFYQLLIGAQPNMIVTSDPAKLYKVTADIYKAYGKDPKEYLGPEPTMDMIDSPLDENTLMVQGQFSKVKAQIYENHMDHIMTHQKLQQSPSLSEIATRAPELVNEIMQFNQQHIQEHMAMMQQIMMMAQGGKSGAISPGGSGAIGAGGPNAGTDGGEGMAGAGGPLAKTVDTKREGKVQSGQGPEI